MAEASVQRWLNAQVPLVTGATGFLGKVIVEKLLRECTELKKVYILLRAKDEADLGKRLQEFKDNMVFERVVKENPSVLDKVIPIKGDLGELRLGISESDEKLVTSDLSVIIHSAAALRFDESIRDSVLMNTRGARELLNLAKRSPKMKSFVYVSTAYSNCYVNVIKEEVYPTPYDPEWMIELCEKNESLDSDMEKAILDVYPNSYIFSKNLAEKVLHNHRSQLPVGIVRPSIITPSVNEPYPGWIDKRSSLLSFLVGGATGFVQSAYGNVFSLADLLPVDLASNGAIVAAFKVGNTPTGDCPVFNLTTGGDTPISWHQFFETEREIIKKNPLPNIFWYPNGTLYENYAVFVLNFILYQMLPAAFYDLLLLMALKKPFLMKMQLKAFKKSESFSFFVRKNFSWETTNTDEMFEKLDPNEKKQFNFKLVGLDFNTYFHDISVGIRRFFYKVADEASPRDVRKMKIYWGIDTLLKTLFYMYLTYWILRVAYMFDVGPLEQIRAAVGLGK